MQLQVVTKTIEMPDGRTITIETGKLARQANGSVVVRMNNTMLLATVVSVKEAKENAEFFPLSVDYQEKYASTGRIPGGFMKRESKLSDYEVLISRLVDRAIRPLFPDNYMAETQISVTLISADDKDAPDALAALAASSALAVSDIPFGGPISEVRVVKVDGEYIVNPVREQMAKATLDVIVAASIDNILMVEGECSEVSEDEMLEALKIAHEIIKIHCKAQIELTEAVGKTQKREFNHVKEDEELKKLLFDTYYDKYYTVAKQCITNKQLRSDAFHAIEDEYFASLPEDTAVNKNIAKRYFHDIHKKAARDLATNEGIRLDGRTTEQIRPIWCEVDYLPMPHGSAVFTRGETQSLATVTLGTKLDEQMIDGAVITGYNKFLLHYNFPAYSTGEVKPNRAPGRREIGHGNLAMRALRKILPSEIENPYTIRIVSDILESNGSSSMATVCAGTLALMDAGVKIKSPASGIAMGMISDPVTGKYAILSDILGDEDHLGDMDFKVTGTVNGITACQMDIKVDGLSYEVLAQALAQAKRGRLHILDEMAKAMTEPREDYKPHAPRTVSIQIPTELIGAVIGPGGKIVQDIQKESGATVIIEEKPGFGLVSIFAVDKLAMEKAYARVKAIVTEPEVGEVYNGVVKSIQPFGAFVEFVKGKDGLLHISEIKWERLETMDGVLEIGEEIQVKLIEIDKKTGKYRLSRKVLLPMPEGMSNNGGGTRERRDDNRGDRKDFQKKDYDKRRK
jgi:polyribonucleotide nucleotidyltransferase